MKAWLLAVTFALAASPCAAKDKKTSEQETKKFSGIEIKKEETDTGRIVDKRYKVDVGKTDNMFLYGGTTTTYPGDRTPGQDYRSTSPLGEPQTTYGVGLGLRF